MRKGKIRGIREIDGDFLWRRLGRTQVVNPLAVDKSADGMNYSSNGQWVEAPRSYGGALQSQLYAMPAATPRSWLTVLKQPITTNDSFVVTLPLSGSGCYFRLQAL